MSSPVRAVDFQWTLRRSSPWRYSRVAASSLPLTATEREAASPPPVQSPPSRTAGSGEQHRRHDQLVGAGERARQLAQAERVGEPHRQRPDAVAAPHVRAHRVGHLAHAARLDLVEDEPRTAAEACRGGRPP